MQIRAQEQHINLNQVGIMNVEDEALQKQKLKKVEQKLSIEEALLTIDQIPDQISFTHDFKFIDERYEKQEESIFNIEAIGELRLGGHLKSGRCKCNKISCEGCSVCCSMIPCCNCKCCKCRCCKCCSCCIEEDFEVIHHYFIPCYILQNEKIRFEHYGTFSKLYIQDTLVLEFICSPPNFTDIRCGSCKSNYPHIYFSIPFHEKNQKILFEPLGNNCPTKPNACLYCCVICSWCGIKQLERRIVAKVGDYGSANIIARRSKRNAWLSQCGCQDDCCHFIDYPDFELKFSNLSNLDKLGLIMATIIYTIDGRWAKYSYRGIFGLNTSYLDF